MTLLQPGDIVLMRTKNIFGDIIVDFLRKTSLKTDVVNYGHVGMMMENNQLLEAHYTIRVIPFDDSKYKHYKIIRHKAVDTFLSFRLMNIGRRFIGQSYGYTRLAAEFFDDIFRTKYFSKLLRNKTNEQICSSLVAYIYQVVLGKQINGLDWYTIDPDDFDDDLEKNSNEWTIIIDK